MRGVGMIREPSLAFSRQMCDSTLLDICAPILNAVLAVLKLKAWLSALILLCEASTIAPASMDTRYVVSDNTGSNGVHSFCWMQQRSMRTPQRCSPPRGLV